jgi:hypothetical protein
VLAAFAGVVFTAGFLIASRRSTAPAA